MPESISYPGNSAGPINQAALPDEELQNQQLDVEQNKLFDYSTARIHLDRIVKDWQTEIEDTEVRRKTRDVEIDVEGLRQKGDLDEDETIIPVRVIDTNIQREIPAYINYLKNSRRITTFRSLSIPNQDPQNIEQEFTRGMTYASWEKPHYKCIDGSASHGWASIEVVLDTSKPLHVSLEYVAHDELYWPRTVKNIQDSPRVIRAYDVTITKLKEWVRNFGFNGDQVEALIKTRKDTQRENETIRIYKLFFKKEGIVFVAWFCLEQALTDWLKDPAQLYLGIAEKQITEVLVDTPTVDPLTGTVVMAQVPQQQEQWVDSPITIYPVFKLPYRETEKPKETDNKGRVFLDENKQEAQTAILSGFVNGITRASNVYASPSTEDGTGASLKEITDVKLCGGRILNRPMIFWGPNYPDPMIIKAMQFFDVQNSAEANQISFSAMNREDSRKTATETQAAQQQQSLLNSVQLTLYSTFIREIYGFAWLIVQSQALQDEIAFLQIQDPQTGAWTNNKQVISQTWELRAAGDVDVIQRQERIAQMKQDWPVIANTPLALRFLSDLMRLSYPDTGDQYAEILNMGNPAQLAIALGMVMQAMMQQHPEMLKTIPPEQQQQLQQMLQQVSVLASSQQQSVTKSGNPPAQAASPSPSNNEQPNPQPQEKATPLGQ